MLATVRGVSLSVPKSAALIVMAAVSLPPISSAQAPQSWTATGYTNQTFPSEQSALAAIHALGGRYQVAEVVQSISSSNNRVTYTYKARPRAPEVGDWQYYGNGFEAYTVTSGEQAAAATLATFQQKYPQCGFKSIQVVDDWKDRIITFENIASAQYRNLEMKATSPTECSRTWAVQHHRERTVSCPKYLGWAGSKKQCIAEFVANTWTSLPPPCEKCQLRGNPVSVVSGSKVQRESDISLDWLEFHRTFDSSYRTLGGIGRHWTHSLNMRLYYNSGGGVGAVLLPDGGILSFSGSEAIDGSGALLRNESGSYVLYWEDGRYRFNGDGRLARIDRYSGDWLSIEFDGMQRISRVVHSTGRNVEFGYIGALADGETELAYVNGQDGPLVAYGYDGEGRLVSAMYRDGSARHYLYENDAYPNALTGIENESGNRFATYSYNADGLAIASEHAGAVGRASFEYQVDGSTTYTNSLGAIERVTFTPGAPYRKIASITTQAGTESWEYAPSTGAGADFRRRVKSHTHRSGRVDFFTYQDLTDPVFGEVRVKRETEASNRAEATVSETWRRRDTNQIVKQVNGDRAQTWLHDARGQVIQESTITSTGEARTTTYRYCDLVAAQTGCPALGLLLSVDGPMPGPADTVTYSYYPEDAPGCASGSASCFYRKGDLWKVANPMGHTVEYLAYDGAGRVATQSDANGLATSFEYHPRGWLTATRVHGVAGVPDRITRIEYWPTGLTKSVTQPDGSYVSYTYDAAQRLVGIADNAGNTIEYVLDAAGNRVAENIRDAAGTLTHTQSRVYDALGKLVTQADASDNPTDFSYDSNGNRTSVTDALGSVTAHEYDPLNRLARSVQDVGGIAAESRFKYNASGDLAEVADPKGLTTRYARNGFGEVVQQTSQDTGVTTFTYDNAGNVQTRTDARGVTATYAYDALGRTTATIFGDPGADIQYIYDRPSAACAVGERAGTSRLASMIDGSGRTDYCYNAMGDLVRRVQTVEGQALTLRYAYDAFGRLQSMTYPDGSLVDYAYDALGQVGSVGVTPAGGAREVLIQGAETLPFGPQKSWTFGNGRRLDRSYDLDYRPQSISDGRDGLNVAFGLDAVGNITALTDHREQDQSVTLNYDALGRLTAFRDGQSGAAIEQYSYDATGNRLSFSNSAGVQPYVYPTDSHRLTSVDGVARTYDSMGNTLTIGGEWQYAYDLAGRLGSAARAGIPKTSYRYNAIGQRVLQQSGADKTLHLYGEGGEWLGAYSASGVSTQQVIWLGSTPVGVIQAGKVLYIESDHIGSPRFVVGPQSDAALWGWSLLGESFGAGNPSEDLDHDGIDQPFDLRFPGQRAERSSGLNYNYFRDYQTETGRYLQSDPIGLYGGLSTYAYVGSSPVSFADPFGLVRSKQCVAAAEVLGAVCGSLGGAYVGGAIGAAGGGAACSPTGPGALVCAGAGGLSGAAAGGLVGGILGQEAGRTAGEAFCPDGGDKCPPCRTLDGRTVPVGTIGFRLDIVPPSRPHFPYVGNHYNLYKAHQIPKNCHCFWQPVGASDAAGGAPPPAGAIPISPFVN